MSPSVEMIVTSGTFSLDGGTWEVDNNVYLIGDDSEVLVIDPAHDHQAILETIGDRKVAGIICTHGHDDHIGQAVAVAEMTGAPISLHPKDLMLWDVVHPGVIPNELSEGQVLEVAGLVVKVLHTPGHSPGGVCLHLPELEVLISGDTLFQGGPGATGRSFSDFQTILDSIREQILTLPSGTKVLPGHGGETTVDDESKDYHAWVTRGR
ncbi:MAG: MBL fold metallo-hydrolase [Actinomycetota bacterium]|nr:MBL fold metallo-hydrolase [Actinomycetota bacterium]